MAGLFPCCKSSRRPHHGIQANSFLKVDGGNGIFSRNILQQHCLMQVMGKVEGQGESWHGHVTAVTVAPEYRRQQLAKKLMYLLEEVSDKIDKAYFVDLFVRASNTPAIKMYEKLDYVVYRRVLRYYSGEEDGLDMRKALSRDVEKKSIIPLKRPVTPDELEYD
ncbi:N-terminal acetyltransferase B complex catalytic subunit NAA20 isoform X2 [Solanum lycopersicum]|uniref:N-terminal acetyltransferase B complex catalytic subunit NAA20 isoform X2 n=1 Tax=Solanum lycopersicum TaxID=4081 RepID=UPI000532AF25|nr:N-terminal acetyltransferase B complex catalytic subunit NAA20 isoform X2 [Solanum lycopersicum]